jgi:hypothetical protein
MATLALSFAGQIVGGAIGGPVGAVLGRALGALAGSAVDNAIFGQRPAAASAPSGELRLQGSSEGGAIPRLYGWGRFTGNIIWATQLEEVTQQSSGGKGTSNSTSTTLLANFAVALCEGEVARLGRIWADGDLLETDNLDFRFYRGSNDQPVDSLIAAKQGAGNAPAYRGLCYLVFEGLDLTPFGNRIPNLSVELCRLAGELEPAIRAITVIPGATEFGYDPVPRVRIVSPGTTASENAHLYPHVSDWTVSLDELQALCPNLQHVSLVIAWFGDDLRAGNCTVAPRVENATKAVDGAAWGVAGLDRAAARIVSQADGGPAYGGTPSDAAVLAAIADLKARGLSVTLYPMLLMDVPADNMLADPHTGAAGQPAYPWRGRITCTPAPGQVGTPDRTAAAAAQVAAFVGGAGDWGYRRFVLHYAGLAGAAGGVDAFLIGSELRGLTFVRGEGDSFPFVAALASLAAEVRTMLGAGTRLTYGADWSEFAGLQPADQPGAKYFHLDALWASPAIDAVGLDNYMPLTDWRDGTDNIDATLWDSIHDPAYLRAGVAGGEGFDWYYASDSDRLQNIRTPIADGVAGEPWVWRYKDLVAWWANAHHDRPGGLRAATPTAWVPASKPIWFTELGCPAVDKGPNQPNVFPDPKSSENARPWFSSGASDGLAQRQFLRAHLGYWRPDGAGFAAVNNPVSPVYGGRMVDPDRLYLWTWDARPYPAFPAAANVWSDGPNHATGHWLSGRLGALASDELIAAVAADYGIAGVEAEAAAPLFLGLAAEAVASARDLLQPALDAAGIEIADGVGGLHFGRTRPRLAVKVAPGDLVATDAPLASRKRPDPNEALARLALGYADRERDYLAGTVTATRLGEGATGGSNTALVLDLAGARSAAERMLAADASARETLDIVLPPSLARLEAGDVLAVEGQGGGPFVITALRDGGARTASLQSAPPEMTMAIVSDRPLAAATTAAARAMPLVTAFQLPGEPADPGASRLMLAATGSPWPGDVVIADDSGSELADLTRRAGQGVLLGPLGPANPALWDRDSVLRLQLYWGHLASVDPLAALGGANRIAVETDAGEWEIVGFADAVLTAPQTYELSRLLRGLGGTGHAIGPASAGRRVVVLDGTVASVPAPADWLGQALDLTAYAGRADPTGTALAAMIATEPALPLAPVHLRAQRNSASGDVAFSWIRCSRGDTESWNTADAPFDYLPEAYAVTIFSGATAVRTLSAAMPAVTYPAAQQIADFGALPADFTFTVAQTSPSLGPGLAAQGAFNG